jgi:hypothetical protein
MPGIKFTSSCYIFIINHPKLEVPGLTCPGRESNPVGGENARKEPFEQLVIAIRNIYI